MNAKLESITNLVFHKKVWVMTHRAHTSDRTVPENSVSSVEDAIDSGAEVIECDTHVTSDGVVVVN